MSSTEIRVLLIDDHRMFADSLARVLDEEADITVLGTAYTAERGLELARSTRPHVVLLDQLLPDRPGLSIIAELGVLLPDVQTVMMTGTTDDRLLAAAIELGCCGFVTKDRAAFEMVAAVRAAAAGEAVVSPHELSQLLPKLRSGYTAYGSDLTPRELEVLHMMSQGVSNADIAERLFLSVNTVRNYVQSILVKLNRHSKLAAVAVAVREGLITLD